MKYLGQTFWIVFWQEVLISWQNLGKILSNFLFFLISVAIFFIIAQNQQNQQSTAFYSILIICFSLLSCLIFSSSEFLKKDFDDGTIEQILGSIENFETFILAKMLANWLTNAFPILVSIFPIALLAGFDLDFAQNFLLLILIATIAINFITTFCGSFVVLTNSASMVALIAFPLIIPILLIVFGGLNQEEFFASFKMLSGLCVFIGSFSVFAAAKIIKIASE
jgi:heme exporter protein CcmB